MLFSGIAQSYRCSTCEKVYSNTIPTSIIPLLIILLAVFALWAEFFDHLLGGNWMIWLLAPFVSVFSFAFAYTALQHFTAPWLKSQACPGCKTKLEAVGGGFVDGVSLAKHELILYLFILGPPILLVLII